MPTFSNLGGITIKCCTMYMPHFWDYICVPMLTCRSSDRRHISLLKQSIDENPHISLDSVAITPNYSPEEGVYFEVVDGVHCFYAILELRGEKLLEHAFTIRVVIYSPRSNDHPSLWHTMTVPQRILCATDLNRLGSLRREISMHDKYHTIQSFIVIEMGTEDKTQLLGNKSSAIGRAISTQLLKRLYHDNSLEVLEKPVLITQQIQRKYGATYCEFFRAAVGFMNCPTSTNIALTDPSIISGSTDQPPLWTKRTFSINNFVRGSDTVKIAILYLIQRKTLKGGLRKESAGRFIRFASHLLCMLPQEEHHLQRVFRCSIKTNRLHPDETLLLHVLGIFGEAWDENGSDESVTGNDCMKKGPYLIANSTLPHVFHALLSGLLPLSEMQRKHMHSLKSTTDVLRNSIVPAVQDHPSLSIRSLANFVEADRTLINSIDDTTAPGTTSIGS